MRRAVIADAVVPGQGALREALLVLSFSLLVALSARVSIYLPFTPVPVTGQTLAVLLTGAVLGARRGALALLAYLAEGTAGLPVFAGGRAGPFWLFPSGGYIVGFVLGAWATGLLADRGWDRGPRVVSALLLGNALIYLPGLLQLGLFVGWENVLKMGLLPFIPGDLLKVALASLLLPSAWRALRALGTAREP